jgi:predicted nucleic acid-binding Zn ribbon protein
MVTAHGLSFFRRRRTQDSGIELELLGSTRTTSDMSKLSVAQINAKIESHEAVCAERWLEIINRVKRVEHFIVATLITLVLGMAGIIFGS